MIKKLLFSCAVAAVALSANAEQLWKAETAEGVLVDWGKAAFALSAEEAAAKIKGGDIVKITVASVTEGGWPQVCIFSDTQGNWGDAIIENAGVGGKDAYPYVASFSITPQTAKTVAETGMAFGGNGAYVSAVEYEKGAFEPSEYAVWFGPKEFGWGNGAGIAAKVFADLKVGDKLVLEYDKTVAKHTFQIVLGAWNNDQGLVGPNIATYQAAAAKDFMTIDEEAGTVTIEFIEALSNLKWGEEGKEEEYDVFKTVKGAGVQTQGEGTVNQILYIPATDTPDDPTAVSTIESVESSVLYNVFGQPVDDNYRGIVIKNGKKILKK